MDMSAPENVGTSRGAQAWISNLRLHILGVPKGPKRDAVISAAAKEVGYAAFVFRKRAVGKLLNAAVQQLKGLADTDDDEDALSRLAHFGLRQAIRLDLWTNRDESPSGKKYPPSVWDKSGVFSWATPAPNSGGGHPEPWRVVKLDVAAQFVKKLMLNSASFQDVYATLPAAMLSPNKEKIQISLRDNSNKDGLDQHRHRIEMISDRLKSLRLPHRMDRAHSYIILIDDLEKNILR